MRGPRGARATKEVCSGAEKEAYCTPVLERAERHARRAVAGVTVVVRVPSIGQRAREVDELVIRREQQLAKVADEASPGVAAQVSCTEIKGSEQGFPSHMHSSIGEGLTPGALSLGLLDLTCAALQPHPGVGEDNAALLGVEQHLDFHHGKGVRGGMCVRCGEE